VGVIGTRVGGHLPPVTPRCWTERFRSLSWHSSSACCFIVSTVGIYAPFMYVRNIYVHDNRLCIASLMYLLRIEGPIFQASLTEFLLIIIITYCYLILSILVQY
jgi:hypothetical protein